MKRTMTDQIDQMENPTCSVATDQTRLRRATSLLPVSQAATSSGSQSRMTRWRGAVSRRRRPGRPVAAARVGDPAALPVVLSVVLPVVVPTDSSWAARAERGGGRAGGAAA